MKYRLKDKIRNLQNVKNIFSISHQLIVSLMKGWGKEEFKAFNHFMGHIFEFLIVDKNLKYKDNFSSVKILKFSRPKFYTSFQK